MNKLLDSIVADEEVLMTDALVRAFEIEGCEPACHCCGEDIVSGDMFKLQMIKTMKEKTLPKKSANDEMLCKDCTADMLILNRKKKRKDYLKWKEVNPGYTRKHM